MIHPLNAASNTYFFLSVAKLEETRLPWPTPLIATAGLADNFHEVLLSESLQTGDVTEVGQ